MTAMQELTIGRSESELPPEQEQKKSQCMIAFVGNPNSGKTTLFNRLTGLRAKTSNFPGTTVEHRIASGKVNGKPAYLLDLPGLYSLDAITPEEKVAKAALMGDVDTLPEPDVVLIVADATNFERNLFLASQTLEMRLPTVVAINQMDLARKAGVHVDAAKLAVELGCPVVPVSARTGEGLDELEQVLCDMLDKPMPPTLESASCMCGSCRGCSYAARYNWAEQVVDHAGMSTTEAHGRMTEALDRIFTHPVVGVIAFGVVMLVTFMLIFWVASYPMDMIDAMFTHIGDWIAQVVPAGDLQSLLVHGVIGGVGGMLVFLPQICILFFMIALLEDSGYLARAAFVMDKLMHKVGLPGKAFVPMLSAHACAIPAIMSARVIENHRDRLATMLVIPLMTCSARVPVYVMLIALLFPNSPVYASLTFWSAYALGILAAISVAFLLKRTILPGKTSPMLIELPNYRVPSLRTALLLTLDRAWLFIKKAGTIILVISLILWFLGTYPKMSTDDMPENIAVQVTQLQTQAQTLEEIEPAQAEALLAEADNLESAAALEYSFIGRLGHVIEPVFEPLGYDWKISVGVLSSFAAREVVVSTLAVIYGLGEDAPEEGNSIYNALRASTWSDGTPVFTVATCLSMLVFYVLAMQCLPTQAVVKRETNSWKWPVFQLAYMSALAYVAALITYQVAAAMGFG